MNALLLVASVSLAAADAGSAVAAPVVVPAPAAAPVKMDAEVKALVDRVQAFYEKTADFTADFRQDYLYKAMKRTVTSSGKVTFKKPSSMRWDYAKPSPKSFVLKDDKVYALDPDAMTLTVSAIVTDKLSASVTFLMGKGKLADEFDIEKKACPACTGTLLQLNPKVPDARFQRVMLEVDPKTASVLKSTVVDPDGSENAITFEKLATNTGVDEKLFKLVPPAGTQIVDFTKVGKP